MSNNTNTKNFNKNQNNNKSGNTGNTGSTPTTTSSSTNELIAAIDNARNTGSPVKQIRKQKHDPNNFYFTLTDGRQFGPVSVTGDQNELNRKFGEAQSYLAGTRNNAKKPQNATAA